MYGLRPRVEQGRAGFLLRRSGYSIALVLGAVPYPQGETSRGPSFGPSDGVKVIVS